MIRDRILELINDEFMVKEVNLDAEFQKEYDLDSIALLDFVMTLEEEFGIEISDAEIGDIKTVNDMITLVESKKGN